MAADLIVFIRMLFFLTACFGCVTKRSCAPKNEQTIHSNYETREREKERGEQIFSDLARDR